MTTICYKTKENKVFLGWYSYKTKKETEKDVAELNKNRPKTYIGCPINWTNIVEFFIDEQEEF